MLFHPPKLAAVRQLHQRPGRKRQRHPVDAVVASPVRATHNVLTLDANRRPLVGKRRRRHKKLALQLRRQPAAIHDLGVKVLRQLARRGSGLSRQRSPFGVRRQLQKASSKPARRRCCPRSDPFSSLVLHAVSIATLRQAVIQPKGYNQRPMNKETVNTFCAVPNDPKRPKRPPEGPKMWKTRGNVENSRPDVENSAWPGSFGPQWPRRAHSVLMTPGPRRRLVWCVADQGGPSGRSSS